MPEKYRPSNGSEGMGFTARYCEQCIHEKWIHTAKDDDKKCDIFSRTILFDVGDEEYPEEWQYNEKGEGVCTAFKYWNWFNNMTGELNEPPEIQPEDPNQLKLF